MPTENTIKMLGEYKAIKEAMTMLTNEQEYRKIEKTEINNNLQNMLYGQDGQPAEDYVIDHEELMQLDKETLKTYVSSVLRGISARYFKQHEQQLRNNDRTFLANDASIINNALRDKIGIDSNTILNGMLSNNDAKFTDDFIEQMVNTDSFETIVELFSDDLFANEADMDEVFKEYKSPFENVSPELRECAATGKNPYDIIPDLLGVSTQTQIEDELQDLIAELPTENDPDRINANMERQRQLTARLGDHDHVKNAADLSGKEISKLFEGVNINDMDGISDRLQEIAAVIANDQSNSLLTLGYNLQGDYQKSARFVIELMKKEAGFSYKWTSVVNDIDYTRIARKAEERFKDRLTQEKIDKYISDYGARANSIHADAQSLSHIFTGDLSSSDVKEQYNTLLSDVLNGRVVLSGLSGTNLDRSPKCIAQVSEYIDRILEEERFENIRTDELTPENIKEICTGKIGSAAAMQEYFTRFHGQLGKREMTDKEYIAMMNDESVKHMNTEASVKYVGITEFVDKDSALLDDAIATYEQARKFHKDHPLYYRFLHPVDYYNEHKMLADMKKVFTEHFKMSKEELAARREGAHERSVDKINLRYMEKKNPEAYKQFVDNYEESRRQRRALVDEKIENVRKFGNAHVNSLPKPMVENKELPKTDISKMTDLEFENYVEKQKNIIYQILENNVSVDDKTVKKYKEADVEKKAFYDEQEGRYMTDNEIKEVIRLGIISDRLDQLESDLREERKDPIAFAMKKEQEQIDLQNDVNAIKYDFEKQQLDKELEKSLDDTGRKTVVEIPKIKMEDAPEIGPDTFKK